MQPEKFLKIFREIGIFTVKNKGRDGVKKVIEFFNSMLKTVYNDKITVYSAYASFYLLISFVPLLMLVLMITGRFVTFNSEDFIMLAGNNLPKSVISFIVYIINDILATNSFSVISIPALTLLWTASRGVVATAKGLDIVYKTEKERSFIKINIFGVIFTFLFMAVVLSSLLVMVLGNVIANVVGQFFPFAVNIINAVLSVRPIVSLVVLTLFFTCIYKFFPSRKLKFIQQIPGAVFASSGWMIFSLLFSIYFDNFSDKSYLYGSLTALVLLMLWIYFCMIFIFLGGELNYFLMGEKSRVD